MKKILSVLCVLAFIASFACIGASAADTAATFSIVAANPEVGATTFTADVVATLPEGGDVTQLGLLVTVPEGLKLVSCEQAVSFGSFVTSETVESNPYMILWVSGTKSLDAGKDTAIATMTFELPADAAVDSAYELVLALEPDNLPASVAGDEYAAEAIVVNGATVTVVEAPVPTTTVTEPPVSEEPIDPPASDEPAPSDKPVVNGAVEDVNAAIAAIGEVTLDSEEAIIAAREAYEALSDEDKALVDISALEAAEAALAALKAEATKPQAPQTGVNNNMMYVVVAVMVVALGAAVVVKKVNVK